MRYDIVRVVFDGPFEVLHRLLVPVLPVRSDAKLEFIVKCLRENGAGRNCKEESRDDDPCVFHVRPHRSNSCPKILLLAFDTAEL